MKSNDIETLDGFIMRIKEHERRSLSRTFIYLAAPIIIGAIFLAYSANQMKKSDSQIHNLQAELVDTQEQLNAYTSQKPVIRITETPPSAGGPDSTFEIRGEVGGVKREDYRVVVYALTDRWYVQPYSDAPFTMIEADGKWSNQTHAGRKYAALLVKNNFEPRQTYSVLPSVGGDVEGISLKTANH